MCVNPFYLSVCFLRYYLVCGRLFCNLEWNCSNWCKEEKKKWDGCWPATFFFLNTEGTLFFSFFFILSLYKLHLASVAVAYSYCFTLLFFCTCLDIRSCGCNFQRLQYKLKCAWLHVDTGCDPQPLLNTPHPWNFATFRYFSFAWVVQSHLSPPLLWTAYIKWGSFRILLWIHING